MQIKLLKNYLISVVLIALAAVLAVLIGFALPKVSYAEGNDAGDASSSSYDVQLVLDINGKDAMLTNELKDTKYYVSSSNKTESNEPNSLTYNNSLHLRVRQISPNAVMESYCARRHIATDTLGPNIATYAFDSTTLRVDSSAIDVMVSNGQLIVSPKSDTDNNEITTDNGRFSISLKSGNDVRTVNFLVVVENTVAQLGTGGWSDIGSNKTLLVGGELDSDGHEKGKPDTGHAAIIEARNFSTFTIDLSQHLKNHALYCNSANATDSNYSTPIVLGADSDTAKMWSLSSVNNLQIRGDISLTGASGAFTHIVKVSSSASSKIAPVIRATLNLDKSVIKEYVSGEYQSITDENERTNKFWRETHNVLLDVSTIDGRQSCQFAIPMKFVPSEPQFIGVKSNTLTMNVTSEFTYDISKGSYFKTALNDEGVETEVTATREELAANPGYNSVIIRPSDIVEYSAPAEWGNADGYVMLFNDKSTGVVSSDGTIQKSIDNLVKIEPYIASEKDLARVSAYRVTMLNNNSVNIDFAVDYYNTAHGYVDGKPRISEKPITFTISTSGYGNYKISLSDIRGKGSVVYNVLTDSIFNSLIRDGYQMTGATSLNGEQLSVQFDQSANTLTLSPLADHINGQAPGNKVALTFTNTSSQTVTIISNEFTIDITANDFFQLFDADWKAWLAIAGMILGGIIIILLIVWLFIRAVSKRRQEEAATQAPVSSYIVKLNSTIAASQAQQRLAATQALTQASSQMLLGAGPTTTQAPSPDTLQLASGVPSQPGSAPTADTGASSEPAPAQSEPKQAEEDYDKLIAEYISDEELLERIFIEKYEPKGMVRRTFFKSKDLQARELEKEKKRIIDRYKTPMPMDEAIMSETELKKAEVTSSPAQSEPREEVVVEEDEINLGFDPDAPLYTPEPERAKDEFSEEKIEFDVSPEQARLDELEKHQAILNKELAELMSRVDKVQRELDKSNAVTGDLEEKIAKAEAENEQLAKEIEELEFKLASARAKEKDRINRDIKIKEEKTERNKNNIEKWRAELEGKTKNADTLNGIMATLNATKEEKANESNALNADLDKAKEDFAAYQDRLAKVKARQEMEAKLGELQPLLVAVNNSDYEIRQLQNFVEKLEKERESLKSEVATAKTQILNTTDFDIINELNGHISDVNARLSEIEKELTKSAKRKTDLNVDLKTQRRKANDYVEKNEIPLEDLIHAEDAVIGNIELGLLKTTIEHDRDEAEQAVATAQAMYDDLSASSGDVTMVAMEVASNIKEIQDELDKTQAELDEINAQMETATDDEKLMLMIDQNEKSDKVDELTEKLKQETIDGTKRKMEAQEDYDKKLESARQTLDDANAEFKAVCDKYDDLVSNTDPLNLITSGSGVISQDQRKREAENLKKQLEKSKNEIEQARLAAELAKTEAEQAKADAARASDEAKAEAERKAQEAMEAAEQARREAEEKARVDAEAAEIARRQAEEETERVKREAEEAIEQARREAEEAAERARVEAEEAAERARVEAEEATERARVEAEEARRMAEEAAERARVEAEEALAAEAEETKRKAQEEIEEMRRKAEEEAEAKRAEEEKLRQEEEERKKAEADRSEAIARKVAGRKEQIILLRNNIKDIKNDEEAKQLREKLYTMQLSFDEDEHGSTELMDFYNKTMDDIQHAGEVATLRAENAKKPQRIVKKVTERVNRIPRKKAGARPSGARPGARPSGARPGARPSGARPGARPSSARPGARPNGARPRPSGTRPSGSRPTRRP